MKSAAPKSLIEAVAELSFRLRMTNLGDRDSSAGLMLYRNILRENISNVLKSVYPLFYRLLSQKKVQYLINDFLLNHHANQPEFHKIATELLYFLRQNTKPEYLAIIEYEWLIYRVEIEDKLILKPQKKEKDYSYSNNTKIVLNPTLKLIGLPFSINNNTLLYPNEASIFYYAIYRKNSGVIYQKRLSFLDAQLLLKLENQSLTLREFKKLAAPNTPSTFINLWLTTNNNDECLSLTP